MALLTAPTKTDGSCPTCGALGGFHDDHSQARLQIPESLTWKPGDPPVWACDCGNFDGHPGDCAMWKYGR